MYSTCSERSPDTNAKIELCVSVVVSLPTTILARMLPTNLNTGGYSTLREGEKGSSIHICVSEKSGVEKRKGRKENVRSIDRESSSRIVS